MIWDIGSVVVFVILLSIQTLYLTGADFRQKELDFTAYCRAHSSMTLRWAIVWFIAAVIGGIIYFVSGPVIPVMFAGSGLIGNLVVATLFGLENRTKKSVNN